MAEHDWVTVGGIRRWCQCCEAYQVMTSQGDWYPAVDMDACPQNSGYAEDRSDHEKHEAG